MAEPPWAVLGGLVVWLGATLPSGYVSVGSIVAAATLPILVALTPHEGGRTLVWFSVGLGAVVIWAHRKNIRRLARGEEHRFGRRKAGQNSGAPGGDWNE